MYDVMCWHRPRCNDQCEDMMRHVACACLGLLQVVGLVLLAYADKFNLPIFFLRLLAYIYARPGREVSGPAESMVSQSLSRPGPENVHPLRLLSE